MGTLFAELLVLGTLMLSFCQGLDQQHKPIVSIYEGQAVPDFIDFTTPEIIQYFGYTAEIYHVVTIDGYILEMHRIPYGINDTSSGSRPVALVVHGLLCSSADFVMDFPDRALGYLLADAGYDVWLANVRGNTYSRAHGWMDPADKEFWQFTWDEMAIYDITIFIDYVLSFTGQSQVYYVGYSMGTTMFFALMSEEPQYADKIATAALIAPVAYAGNMKGAMKRIANYSDALDRLLSLTGHSEVLQSGPRMDFLAENYCAMDYNTSVICEDVLFAICGFDQAEMNEPWLANILSHTPAGTSVHTINHYGQIVVSKNFQKYDWGLIGNQNHYGNNTPPKYDITGPTPPIALFWGQNDFLATPEDVVITSADLQNLVLSHRVEWDTWNHLDFIWGIHAKEYVYDYILAYLANY